MNPRALAIGLVFTFLSVAPPANATPLSIGYLTSDLTDVVDGEDLWRFSYFVGGPNFPVGRGFSIYFDHSVYRNLQDPAVAPNGDWDVLTYQPEPDATLASPGLYDALSRIDGASLADPFEIDFVWLGLPGTQPGSQPFEVYALDPDGGLTVLETGSTTPVPEPGTLLLVATGALALARGRRRRSRSR